MNATVEYSFHPDGVPHQRATVHKMLELARAGAHTYEIRHLATEITRHIPSKQPLAELAAIYVWVDRNIRYRNDPVGLEWVQSPSRTIAEGAGDCDDIGTLLASLALALGRDIQVSTVGPWPGPDVPHDHVWLEAQLPDGTWVPLDPVLEPARDHVGAAPELGPGWRARGHMRTWNVEGTQMALGAPTTPRDRLLWQTVPYFPQVPPTGGYADPANAGRALPPDFRYMSAGAPGGGIAWSQASGMWELRGLEGLTCPADAAGIPRSGETKDLWEFARMNEADREAFIASGGCLRTQSISELVQPVTDAAQALQPLTPAIALIPGVGIPAAAAINAVATGGQIIGNVSESRPGVPQVGVQPAPTGILPPGVSQDVTSPAPGRVVVTTTVGEIAAVPLEQALAMQELVQQGPDTRSVYAELRSKYPPDARQLWDPTSNTYRIFVPLAGGVALGALRPTISFAFGADPHGPHQHQVVLPCGLAILTEETFAGWLAPASPVLGALVPAQPGWAGPIEWANDFASFRALGYELARRAASAVAAYMTSHEAPPTVPLSDVQRFQEHDRLWGLRSVPNGDMLFVDGLWGINTRAAANWYTADRFEFPPFNSKFTNPLTWDSPAYEATWIPPTVYVPPPSPVEPGILTIEDCVRDETGACVVIDIPAPTPTPAPPLPVPEPEFIEVQPPPPPAPPPPVVVPPPAPPPVAVDCPPTFCPMPPAPTPTIVTVPREGLPTHIPTTGPGSSPALCGVLGACSTCRAPLEQPGPCRACGATGAPGGTQAACGGACPPGAVWRDASGTARVTGYVEVAQESHNPGMPPVGYDVPQTLPQGDVGPPVSRVRGASTSSTTRPSVAGGATELNPWVIGLGLWVLARSRKGARSS